MASKKAEVDLTFDVEDTTVKEVPETILSFDDLEVVEDSLDDALELVDSVEVDDVEIVATVPKSAVKVGMDLTDIESLITEVDDNVEFLTWLIYGKNGTGKTTLLSTTDGMLILAYEDGTLSIKDKAKGKAMKIQIDLWEKTEGVYWLLKKGTVIKNTKGEVMGIDIKTKKGNFLVKSIGFDTVTKAADVCMRNIVLGEKEDDPTKDIIKKTLKNWGDMSEKLKYWLQMFQEFPIQKVWLFQETSNADDLDSDEYSIFPNINKSVRNYAMGEADIIARTYIAKTPKGMQFRLSAAPNDKYVTKDRTNKLKIVANPNLSAIYKLVFDKEI